jgi:hypothetical protein
MIITPYIDLWRYGMFACTITKATTMPEIITPYNQHINRISARLKNNPVRSER